MILPLKLGPLAAKGFNLRRSGIHWLCADGHECQVGEVIAFCNLGVEPQGLRRLAVQPFAGERALQVAFASRVAGRLSIAAGSSAGGFLDVLGVHDWNAEDVIAGLEPSAGAVDGPGAGILRPLMLAGRRMSWVVDVDTGLLPGWHSRARAWWGEGDEHRPTLLSLGFCDATGVVRGDSSGFVEMFGAAPFAAQMVHVSEHPLTPCAPVLFEQFVRTPAQLEAISADLMHGLGKGNPAPTPEDWIFAGALLAQLGHSPMRESYDILTASGLSKSPPADAILLSLGAEPRSILRHRLLDYHLNILPHDLEAAGPAIRAWMAAAFQSVSRSLEDIRRDYIRLVDTVRAATGARFLILNQMSTSGREDISSYAPFDAPMSDTLSNIAAKALNLTLHDLAEERDLFIVDVDALAAEIGGAVHLPDGVHQSGTLQARVREEILDILARL